MAGGSLGIVEGRSKRSGSGGREGRAPAAPVATGDGPTHTTGLAPRVAAQTEVRLARKIRKKIGEILLEKGKVKPEQLEAAIEQARATGKRTGELLVEMSATTEEAVA
jgi:type IV pilus assembly protein PilB